MFYYLTENRVNVDGCWQRQEQDGSWSYTTKLPKLLKKYPYCQIGISVDGSRSIVATWDEVQELTPITQEEAQGYINQWFVDMHGDSSVIQGENPDGSLNVLRATDISKLDFNRIRTEIDSLRGQLKEDGEI